MSNVSLGLVQGDMVNGLLQEEGARRLLWSNRKKLEGLLPSHMSSDRFLALAFRCFCDNFKTLSKCSPESIFESVLKAAKFGLELDGILGEAYLVPYKRECQLIPGYKGLMKLGLQSKEVKSILPAVVYNVDRFRYELGMHVDVKHLPKAISDEQMADDQVEYFYAIFDLTNGARVPFVWPVAKIRAHRDKYSTSYKYAEQGYQGATPSKDSIWHKHFQRMGLKTVLRDAMSGGTIPMSSEVVQMLQIEKKLEGEEDADEVTKEMDRLAAQSAQKRLAAQPQSPTFEPDSDHREPEPVPERVSRDRVKQQQEPKRTFVDASYPPEGEEPEVDQPKATATMERPRANGKSAKPTGAPPVESDPVAAWGSKIDGATDEEDAQVVALNIKRSQDLTTEQKAFLSRRVNDKIRSFHG